MSNGSKLFDAMILHYYFYNRSKINEISLTCHQSMEEAGNENFQKGKLKNKNSIFIVKCALYKKSFGLARFLVLVLIDFFYIFCHLFCSEYDQHFSNANHYFLTPQPHLFHQSYG